MSDIFISYARSTAAEAGRIEEALRALGFEVWRDSELPAHRAYAEVIEERLRAARAVVVVWSAEAVRSQWVRAEADMARQAGTLVQLSIDGAVPPLPFNQIQCADMAGWNGRADHPGWRKVVQSATELAGASRPAGTPASSRAPPTLRPRRPVRLFRWVAAGFAAAGLLAIGAFIVWGPLRQSTAPPGSMRSLVVLPIRNLTGDPSLDAVADALTEDAIDVLGRAGLLNVTPRDATFALKGKAFDARLLGRQLNVRHVVAASLRRPGPGYSVSYQIIDTSNGQVVGAKEVGVTTSDASLAERQLALKLFSAISQVVQGRWVDAELARPPDDRDPETIVARLERLADDNRRQDLGKAGRLMAAGRAAIPRNSPLRAEFDMAACNYESGVIGAGYETTPARRADRAAAALDFGAEAAELKPNATSPHVCRAGMFGQLERWDEATAEARHVIQIFPLTANGYGVLASVELAQGRFADALKDFTEFQARTEPDPADLGITHLFRGEYNVAIDELRDAAVRDPKDPNAPFFLAAALELSGQHDKATDQAGFYRTLKSDGGVWRTLALSHEPAFLRPARVIRRALHDSGLDEAGVGPVPAK